MKFKQKKNRNFQSNDTHEIKLSIPAVELLLN